jgi:hypothetical protein
MWSYHSQVGRTRKENAPEFNPVHLPCGPQSTIWQYGQPPNPDQEDDGLPRDLKVDTDLLKGEVWGRLWTP